MPLCTYVKPPTLKSQLTQHFHFHPTLSSRQRPLSRFLLLPYQLPCVQNTPCQLVTKATALLKLTVFCLHSGLHLKLHQLQLQKHGIRPKPHLTRDRLLGPRRLIAQLWRLRRLTKRMILSKTPKMAKMLRKTPSTSHAPFPTAMRNLLPSSCLNVTRMSVTTTANAAI